MAKRRKRAIRVFGEELVRQRRQSGLTQEQLAEKAGVSIRALRNAENKGSVERKTLESIARVLRLPPEGMVIDSERAPAYVDATIHFKEFLESVWNRNDLSVVDRLLAPEFRFHHESGVVTGRKVMKERIRVFKSSFSEFDFVVDEVYAFNAFVVGRWHVGMTQSGPWRDLPPTGRRVTVHGTSWVQIVAGLFGDAWDFWDTEGIYSELSADLPSQTER